MSTESNQNNQGPGVQNDGYMQVYDRTYHILVAEAPELLIPLMNDYFDLHYGKNAKVTVLLSDFLENPEDEKSKVRKLDSLFRVEDEDNPDLDSDFLMECETRKDNSISIRFFRYGSLRAVHNYYVDAEGMYHFKFPRLALLYLRPNASTPKKACAYVGAYGVDDELAIPIEVRTMKGYTLKEMIEKDLFFLIPFWPFHFVSMASWEKDPEHKGFYKAFVPIFSWLKESEEKLTSVVAQLLLILLFQVLREHAKNYPVLVEEVRKMENMEEFVPFLKVKHELERKDEVIRKTDEVNKKMEEMIKDDPNPSPQMLEILKMIQEINTLKAEEEEAPGE